MVLTYRRRRQRQHRRIGAERGPTVGALPGAPHEPFGRDISPTEVDDR
jgi:hypothetical protein